MPIAVSCPSCSGSFKVKDEYAGKRAKCPKCGVPLTIPAADVEMADDEPAPASARTAKPVASKKPKPAEDEPDENPRSRKSPADNKDDEDDKPKVKKKREDDDDEQPKKQKRGGGDPPKKKRSALPLILGIVVGVVLLCCGGPIGVWFIWVVPAGEKLASQIAQLPTYPVDEPIKQSPTVTRANFAKLQAGMTQSQVVAIMGTGREGTSTDLQFTTPYYSDHAEGNSAQTRWGVAVAKRNVLVWNQAPERILVAFTYDAPDGKVEGVVGVFQPPGEKYLVATESVRLPGVGEAAANPLLKTENIYGKLNRGHTVADVEKQIGKGQKADVTTVRADVAKLEVKDEVKKLWEQYAEKGLVYRWDNYADRVLVAFSQPEAGGGLQAVVLTFNGNTSNLLDPRPLLETLTVTAAELAAAFDQDATAAESKYKDKLFTLTGTVAEVGPRGLDVTLTGVSGGPSKRTVLVKVSMDGAQWKAAEALKPGDSVKLNCSSQLMSYRQEFNQPVWKLGLMNGRLLK